MHLVSGTTRIIRGIILVLPFLIHLAVADILISLLLPLSPFYPRWTYRISSSLAAGVWGHIQIVFESFNGAKIIQSSRGFIEHGTQADHSAPRYKGESALVVSNHISWTDFYMLQSLGLSTEPAMLPYQRYFAKSSLRFVPLLGWGLWALRMPLVSRRWATDKFEIERIFRGPCERNEPIWLVMFSEGTRWTKQKWEQGVAWARSKGKTEPSPYLLAPRSKGFIASVRGLRGGGISCIINVTIAYATKEEKSPKAARKGEWRFMKAPSMWTTLSTPNISTNHAFWIHAERFDISKLPEEDSELESWLEQRWREKGLRLQKLGEKIESGEDVFKLLL